MRFLSSPARLFPLPSRGVAIAVAAALFVSVLSGMQGLVTSPAAAEDDPAVATAPVELIGERTETSTTFENPDGTRTLEMSGSPIRVVDENAEDGWSDVDYNLEVKSDGTVAPIVSPVDLWISGGETKEAARLTNDDGTFVAVTWPELLPEPSIDGGTATFQISETSTLVIIVTGSGFNAHIVLEEAPEVGTDTFTLGLKTKDIDVSEANNHLTITDEDGDKVVESQSLTAWDSRVDDAGDPLLPVTLTADLDEGTQVGGTLRQELELTTPSGYLSDPETEYPVVIDPSLTQLTQTRDTYVVSGTSTSNGTSGVLRVGSNDGVSPAESYLQFNLAPITDAMTVIDVDMQLWQYYAPSCGTYPVAIAALTGTWDSNQTWATRPAASATGGFWWAFANKGPSACANGWQSIDLTTMTNSWLDGSRVNRGIRISIPAAEALNTVYDKRFCSLNPDSSHSICSMSYRQPKLVVTYLSPPAATSPTPQTGSFPTSPPTLGVSIADSTTTGIQAQYVLGLNSEPSNSPVVQSSWAPLGNYQLQPNALKAGKKYFWKVRLRDGPTGPTSISQIWNFTYSPPAPNNVPSVPALDAARPSSSTDSSLVVGMNPIFGSIAADLDADDNITTYFDVYNVSSGGTPTTFLDRCSSQSAVDEIAQCSPGVALTAGTSYALRLRAQDDYSPSAGWSAWSAWIPFATSDDLDDEPIVTQKQLPLDHAISLGNAAIVANSVDDDVVGYRFESSDLVGEWFPEEDETTNDFLDEFDDDYATEPEITALIVELPLDETVTAGRTSTDESEEPLVTGMPELDAPAATGPEIVEFNATVAANDAEIANQEALPEGTAGAPSSYSGNGQWRPSSVSSEIYKKKIKGKKKVVFKSAYHWDGVHESAGRVDDDFGLEFEFDAITDSTEWTKRAIRCDYNYFSNLHGRCSVTGERCDASDARKVPFAKNRAWSWTVYAKKDGNTKKNWTQELGAYADKNDLWDSCRRNSMGIGLYDPQSLVGTASGGKKSQNLFLKITAPKGEDDSGKTAGRIQVVDRVRCEQIGSLIPVHLTDCMGTAPTEEWDAPGDDEAMQVLSKNRNWHAPTKCWTTTNHGSSLQITTAFCGPNVDPW